MVNVYLYSFIKIHLIGEMSFKVQQASDKYGINPVCFICFASVSCSITVVLGIIIIINLFICFSCSVAMKRPFRSSEDDISPPAKYSREERRGMIYCTCVKSTSQQDMSQSSVLTLMFSCSPAVRKKRNGWGFWCTDAKIPNTEKFAWGSKYSVTQYSTWHEHFDS